MSNKSTEDVGRKCSVLTSASLPSMQSLQRGAIATAKVVYWVRVVSTKELKARIFRQITDIITQHMKNLAKFETVFLRRSVLTS